MRTALDFLGFGLPPGAPSLGELVAQGKSNLQAPWLGISAFAVLAIMLSLLVFIWSRLAELKWAVTTYIAMTLLMVWRRGT